MIDMLESCWPNGLTWIYPHLDHTFFFWGKWDLRFICPAWHGILSIQFMAKQLRCRILCIWLQSSIVKWGVLSFATIIELLCTRWVYERARSLALDDTNQLVDNCLQISSYSYKVSPIAIVSHYKLIILMTWLVLMIVGTGPSMIEDKDNKGSYVWELWNRLWLL